MKNQITLDGVTISWRDTRRMVPAAEPDDFELCGEFEIHISADGVPLESVANAAVCAETLQKAADYGDMLCPHSNSRLRAVGLNSIGTVVLQIYKGDRKCDAVPVSDLSHFDPQRYSKAGDQAMKSIAWMRDVARAIVAYRNSVIRHRCLERTHVSLFAV